MNRRTVALLALGVLICRAVPSAGQTSKGGVTVGTYVEHADPLTKLHVTVENDNDYMVKNVAYTIQWTCGDRPGTTAPGKNFDPVALVAAGQTYDNAVNACTGAFVVQDVRLISFDKFQPTTQITQQPAPAPAPPLPQASPAPSPKLTLDQTMKWIQVTLDAHGSVPYAIDKYNPHCVSTHKVDSFSGCKVQLHVIETGCATSEIVCTIDLSGLSPAVTWTIDGVFGEVILPVSDRTKQSCSLINDRDQIMVGTDTNGPSVQGLTNAFAYAIKLCGGAASPF